MEVENHGQRWTETENKEENTQRNGSNEGKKAAEMEKKKWLMDRSIKDSSSNKFYKVSTVWYGS